MFAVCWSRCAARRALGRATQVEAHEQVARAQPSDQAKSVVLFFSSAPALPPNDLLPVPLYPSSLRRTPPRSTGRGCRQKFRWRGVGADASGDLTDFACKRRGCYRMLLSSSAARKPAWSPIPLSVTSCYAGPLRKPHELVLYLRILQNMKSCGLLAPRCHESLAQRRRAPPAARRLRRRRV